MKGMLWKPKRGANESLGITNDINTGRAIEYRIDEVDPVGNGGG